MSFIQSTLKCERCGHKMNVAFGIVGTQQIAGWPAECPKCGSKQLTKISEGWSAGEEEVDDKPKEPIKLGTGWPWEIANLFRYAIKLADWWAKKFYLKSNNGGGGISL